MDVVGYVMLAIIFVMLGILIGSLIPASDSNRLQQENKRLKRLLIAVLDIEGISSEAYWQIFRDVTRETRQAKPLARKKLTAPKTSKEGKVKHSA